MRKPIATRWANFYATCAADHAARAQRMMRDIEACASGEHPQGYEYSIYTVVNVTNEQERARANSALMRLHLWKVLEK